MTANIQAFLNERKELWLKEKLKEANTEAKSMEVHQQADERFSAQVWIPDAANRAGQLSMASHTCKFSHPSSKTSNVIAQATALNDGYLRSGNVEYSLDVFGNAAAMDVFKFLSINLDNGQIILDAFEQQADYLKQFIEAHALDFYALRSAFLAIKFKDDDTTVKTDQLVKQVYFPIGKMEYHLLSLLTPSGLFTELKTKIDVMRFSDETKLAKERRKNGEFDDVGFADIYDLTVMAYGGTKPQNISVLNNQNGGRAYLLLSAPPNFEKRTIRLPNRDFFSQCLSPYKFRENFEKLRALIRKDLENDTGVQKNNPHTRKKIKYILRDIIESVLYTANRVRKTKSAWSVSNTYQDLPLAQRVWLDSAYTTERESNEYHEEICNDLAKWIMRSYEYKTITTDSYMLGQNEMNAIKSIVVELIDEDKEFF